MVYVKTKKELQIAVERREREIIVVGELAEKLKPIYKLKKFSKSKMNRAISLIPLLNDSLSIISPLVNIGNNSIVLSGIRKIVEGGLLKNNTNSRVLQGFTGAEIIFIIMILTAAGLAVMALLRDYDIDLKMNPIDGIRFNAKKPQGQN